MKYVVNRLSKIAYIFTPYMLLPNNMIWLIEVNMVAISEAIWMQQKKCLKPMIYMTKTEIKLVEANVSVFLIN